MAGDRGKVPVRRDARVKGAKALAVVGDHAYLSAGQSPLAAVVGCYICGRSRQEHGA